MAHVSKISKKMLTEKPFKQANAPVPSVTGTMRLNTLKPKLAYSNSMAAVEAPIADRILNYSESELDERSLRRQGRSKGSSSYLAVNTPAPQEKEARTQRSPSFFDSWNPEPESTDDSSASQVVAAKRQLTESEETYQQQTAMNLYQNAVDMYIGGGAVNASGTTSALAPLRPEWMGEISQRIALPAAAVEGVPGSAEKAIKEMQDEIKDIYSVSVAKSMINYELESPRGSDKLGVDKTYLSAEANWWTSNEYQVAEWRVLRETGVPRNNVWSRSQNDGALPMHYGACSGGSPAPLGMWQAASRLEPERHGEDN
jgi:hypothetical protein